MSWSDVFSLSVRLLWGIGRLAYEHAWRHPWAVGAALYGLARTFGVMIQSGQRGVLFRWGRVVKELEPGFHWLIPVVHGVKTTHVRSVTIELPAQKVMTADGLVYDVGVNLVYRVEDATKALTLIDHVDAGSRAALPIIVTEVIRTRDQAELVDREALDRALFERMNAWIARWGLVVEQAGFTTIAPNRGVLRTTQLRSKTRERARALHLLMEGGLDAQSALIMLGTERRPRAESSSRYHRHTRLADRRPLKPSAAPPTAKTAKPAKTAKTTKSRQPTATTGAASRRLG